MHWWFLPVFFDEAAGPHSVQQIAFGDYLSGITDKRSEYVVRFRRQRHAFRAPEQLPAGNIEDEVAELIAIFSAHVSSIDLTGILGNS
jgi:hypothetical protein